MRRKILGSVQAEMTERVTVIIIQVLRIVLTNSFLCAIIKIPRGGGALRPSWVSPPTDCCYQSGECDYCFDYQACNFVGGGVFIFVSHRCVPPFCIYYIILSAVCQ